MQVALHASFHAALSVCSHPVLWCMSVSSTGWEDWPCCPIHLANTSSLSCKTQLKCSHFRDAFHCHRQDFHSFSSTGTRTFAYRVLYLCVYWAQGRGSLSVALHLISRHPAVTYTSLTPMITECNSVYL